ncbi:hypothetical protein IAT40_007814 [Kwoniella sp. CBS 6097]
MSESHQTPPPEKSTVSIPHSLSSPSGEAVSTLNAQETPSLGPDASETVERISRISNVNSSSRGSVISYRHLRFQGDLCEKLVTRYHDRADVWLPVSARPDSHTEGRRDSILVRGSGREKLHVGHLWTISRGTLSLESEPAIAGHPHQQTSRKPSLEIPVVVKILDTDPDEISERNGPGYLVYQDYGEP